MFTERLRRVMDQIARLPEEEQNELAARIEADLPEDRHLATAMDDPHELVLDKLFAEAKQEVANGEARDLDELL